MNNLLVSIELRITYVVYKQWMNMYIQLIDIITQARTPHDDHTLLWHYYEYGD